MTTAGQLRERVAFEARAYADDGMGNVQAGPWQIMHECAARIMPKLGGESVQAQRLSGMQPMLITVRGCRALRDLASDWRIRDVRKGTLYNVTSVSNPDERGAWIEVLAVSGEAT